MNDSSACGTMKAVFGERGAAVGGRFAQRRHAMSSQQFVIQSQQSDSRGLASIGSRAEVLRELAHFNTMPEAQDGDVLYGPGIRIELTPGQDPVTQMLLSVVEEEIAWLVIMRLAKTLRWKILDPVSGRELTAASVDEAV